MSFDGTSLTPNQGLPGALTRRALIGTGSIAIGAYSLACGVGTRSDEPKTSLAKANLSFVQRGGTAYQELHKERSETYMKLAPGSQVTAEQLTGNGDEQVAKLVALAAGGTPPDLAVHLDHQQVVRLASSGSILAPLDSYIGRDKQLNIQDIHPEVQAQYRFLKKTFGIGHGVALTSLFVNLDMFAAAGVTPPLTDWKDQRWTMQAFLDAASKMTRQNGHGGFDQAGVVMEQVSWNGNIGNWVISNGGAFLDDLEAPKRCILDSPQTREALQFVTDLQQRRQVWAAGDALEGKMPQDWFTSGRAAMYHGGSFKINALRAATQANANWDVVPLPRFKQPMVGLGGSGVSMLSGSTQKDAAWELLRFMVDVDYNRLQAKAGLDTPARTSVLNSAEFLGEAPPPKSRKVIADSVQYGRAKNIRSLKGPDVESTINRNASSLFAGKISLSEFLTQTCTAVTPLIGD